MKNRMKAIAVVAVVMVFVATMSSCNRGMGCPTNFSIGKLVNVIR